MVRSVHLISHGCVFLRQDSRPKGSVAEPGPSPGALSLGPDVLQGRLQQELVWCCPGAVPGVTRELGELWVGCGAGSASLLLGGETETSGKLLLNELLCEIQEKPSPPRLSNCQEPALGNRVGSFSHPLPIPDVVEAERIQARCWGPIGPASCMGVEGARSGVLLFENEP